MSHCYRLSIPALALVCALVAALALPAQTEGAQLSGFHTPSMNIGCLAYNGHLRCDIAEKSWHGPARPASCPLAYGDSLTLSARGKPIWTCHGDTVLRQGRPLAYGTLWRLGSFTCSSWPEGLTCTNRMGHGFFLSRQTYRVF